MANLNKEELLQLSKEELIEKLEKVENSYTNSVNYYCGKLDRMKKLLEAVGVILMAAKEI